MGQEGEKREEEFSEPTRGRISLSKSIFSSLLTFLEQKDSLLLSKSQVFGHPVKHLIECEEDAVKIAWN